jgi:8-oxo-dGTP diphosphatase
VRPGQRLAAYALIFDSTGRLLLTREPGGRPGRWLLPGGGVEHGEHPEQAVVREVREETGLDARVGSLREVVSDVTIVGRRRRSLHNVRLIYQAVLVPAAASSPGSPPPGEVRWCTPDQWRTLPLAPFVAQVLESGLG